LEGRLLAAVMTTGVMLDEGELTNGTWEKGRRLVNA
jgi:hypothetical protein